jgi:hypothetical protein
LNPQEMTAYLRHTHDKDLHQDYLDHINSFTSFTLQPILVNSINSDLVDIDKNKVNLYSELDNSTVPPIVVANGVILDGYHRVTVARAQGRESILAYVG